MFFAAELELAVGNPERALGLYQRLLDRGARGHLRYRMVRGACFAAGASRQHGRVLQHCMALLSFVTHPEPDVFRFCAEAYLATGDPRRARECGLELIRQRRREPDGYVLVGDTYARAFEWHQASAFYQQARDHAAPRRVIEPRLYRATFYTCRDRGHRGADLGACIYGTRTTPTIARPTRNEISNVMGGLREDVYACGVRAALSEGTVRVTVKVSPDGSVGNVTVHGAPTDVAACIEAALAPARFPPTTRGVVVNQPYVLAASAFAAPD